MTLGEIFITAFVGIIFTLGIYGGTRLYRWNMRDMKAKEERNLAARKIQNLKDE